MTQDEQQFLKRLGQAIAKKRKAAGYTQEKVAEKLEIGSEAVSRIERGLVSPGFPRLFQLADLFGCGIESFFVEGSRRPSDVGERVARMLEGLSESDRTLILAIIERLSKRLSKAADDFDV
ncbi:helix-turn-helix domain-containing protein [Bordetella ansorpii]|uniref:helix-turn-helix domain-containing protein n=1 Tax=Bordetella ansorpii TaxID=288768 RepID=UPI000825FB00|nr:helix-turn-helix transcriptional regulator [Bordetella ansorpii]